MKNILPLVLCACTATGYGLAQDYSPTQTAPLQPTPEMKNGEPLYKIQVVGRDIPAINYFHRSGSTEIGFQGTALLAQGKGSAKVDSGQGRTTIHASFQGLVPANSFGAEYLTYVLWAITPDGRPTNLGEVLPNGSKGSINVTTGLQSFGLIVTAEPYFAVTMPSDVVVLQNEVLKHKTSGILDTVNAHFNLLPRGVYAQSGGQHSVLRPITRKEKSPLELYEAINAVQIAQAAGADKNAPEILNKAKQELSNAQDMDVHHKERKQEITYARAAVEDAEDARLVTLRKEQADERAAEQQAARDKQQQAQQQAQQAQLQAQEAATRRAEAEAKAAQAQAEAAKAQAAQLQAEHSAQTANQQAEQAREQLKQQLNSVLQTQETARGLIVNLSDVLFDFNSYKLKPDTQLKLARVSGILLAYPNLKVQVEGYTDNVGTEQYNQKLSQERADAVRSFLVQQGVPDGNVTATGYGEADPVAPNNTGAGRAKNRRVQMVVSGAAIGIGQQSGPGQSSPANAPGQGGEQPPASSPQNAQPPAPPANPTGVSNPPGQGPQ
jgi:outer membrane protein OmpA-like peptidoglycan-associated protein